MAMMTTPPATSPAIVPALATWPAKQVGDRDETRASKADKSEPQ
jgi:hypothetical protein